LENSLVQPYIAQINLYDLKCAAEEKKERVNFEKHSQKERPESGRPNRSQKLHRYLSSNKKVEGEVKEKENDSSK